MKYIVLSKIDVEGIKTLLSPYFEDFTTILLWVIPVIAGVCALVSSVKWFAKDEDEREQKPLEKTLWKIGIYAVIVELIPVLYKLFGA